MKIMFSVNIHNLFRQLKHAREGVSHGGLGLLARHRRRQRLKAMLDVLKSLKTLVRTCTCLLFTYIILNHTPTSTVRIVISTFICQ